MMGITNAVNMAKGLEILGLIQRNDWMTPKIVLKSHRDHLIKKVCDNAARVGAGKRPI